MRTSISTMGLLVVSNVFLSGCGGRQGESSATAMIDLLPNHINERTRSDTADTYNRETIFDYINGAGEVYRAYAFRRVVVARYSGSQGPDVLVELFDMGSAADAYGVFSYAREEEESGIGGGYEHKGDVLCFWQDRFYACVTMEEPAPESDRALVEVARAISRELPPVWDRPHLVSMLPREGLIASSERFFHLQHALNYHYYLARENILNLSAETDAVMARYEPGTTYVLIVRYGSDSDAAQALSSFRRGYLPESLDVETVATEDGRFVSSVHTGRYVVVVLDADSETVAGTLMRAAVDGLAE